MYVCIEERMKSSHNRPTIGPGERVPAELVFVDSQANVLVSIVVVYDDTVAGGVDDTPAIDRC